MADIKAIAEQLVNLTVAEVNELAKELKENYGIDCFLFMGEGKDHSRLMELVRYIKENYTIKVAIYSGRDKVETEYYGLFDYVKVGGYKEEYGPLNKETTNQKLFKVKDGKLYENITYKFWNTGYKHENIGFSRTYSCR